MPKNPISGLPPKKQRYIRALSKGCTKQEAALQAGYSPTTAKNAHSIETPDVKAAFAEVMRKKISARRIAEKISKGMDAKETKFFADKGIVIDSREVEAWGEQRQFTDMAARYGGYYNPKSELEVTQTIDEATMRRLADIADKIGLTAIKQDDVKELRKSYVVLECEQKAEDSDEDSNKDGV